MLGSLREAGVKVVPSDAPADAIVVNTCGFLEASREESLSVLRDAIERKERGEIGRVVVAGCLVQRHRAKLLEWAPGIDSMIGVFDRDRIVDAVSTSPPEREGLDENGPRYWIAGNALQAAAERGRDVVGLTVAGDDGKGIGFRDFVTFCRGADMLVHDCQYIPEEMGVRRGWGHSDTESVVRLAVEAGVKHLVLFHHDPWRKDREIMAMVDRCSQAIEEARVSILVEAAREGVTLRI